MNQRDQQVLSLRPPVSFDKDAPRNELEKFHHGVLRPILKFQNLLILKQFYSWGTENKQSFEKGSEKEVRDFVNHCVKTHKRLRATFLGMIIGQLTEIEFDFYQDNQKELNRRITSMLVERIVSQYSALEKMNVDI